MKFSLLIALALGLVSSAQTIDKREISGIYPHLAMFNSGNECGTGAVVPWANRLWAITYSPHEPRGSSDKLYEIDDQLNQTIRPESIGGTPANRMIHRESNQLFIGPYAIDGKGKVRAIPYDRMPGRPTGNAKHLTDPANKIYYASMEEGFYEVDVHSLNVRQLYADANGAYERKEIPNIEGPLLPGYHGKGFYMGQGRLVYANNGEIGGGNLPPDIPSGCLAEWDGRNWTVIRRNQFTEVTGPGGIYGNADPARDPIWSVGWDHRSVILMVLDKGRWHSYRLPKGTHTYDGAHGWNTEWPRIRDIGEKDLLMTMHGMFWRFPRVFTPGKSSGITPRSTYLRVVGDFTRWKDRIVFGSDDTAKAEFFNTRRAKGKIAGPGQSQSNLWFVEPERLDKLGIPIGRGAVWIRDDVKSGEPSEPYLFSGFDRRMVHVAHEEGVEVKFTFEVDRTGNGTWAKLRDLQVPARGYAFAVFDDKDKGAWIRVKADKNTHAATVFFQYADADIRVTSPAPVFDGLARPNDGKASAGLVWPRGENKGTLLFAELAKDALYELGADLHLKRFDDAGTLKWMKDHLTPPSAFLKTDSASVIYTDEAGKRWRLPKGDPAFDRLTAPVRIAREVSTERDLLNVHGTFYELPSNNAGGIQMVRPVATHNLSFYDYCSWRGLVVLSGVSGTPVSNSRIVRSGDGEAALWVGVSDDLWQLGKVRGEGGPWRGTQVKSGDPSDPYLMTGFDEKELVLSHDQSRPVRMRVEIDITGSGLWASYAVFDVLPGKELRHTFPTGFNAYWVRTVAMADSKATALLTYR
ncbi:MAG: hypothetical protein H7Y20_00630 [Bryobacteraceae bacterium]|nr:hypothetical protein [Bryobacteraceae bacterium]